MVVPVLRILGDFVCKLEFSSILVSLVNIIVYSFYIFGFSFSLDLFIFHTQVLYARPMMEKLK